MLTTKFEKEYPMIYSTLESVCSAVVAEMARVADESDIRSDIE
jgi:hypothetical protein